MLQTDLHRIADPLSRLKAGTDDLHHMPQFTAGDWPLIERWRALAEIWHTHHMGESKRRRMAALARDEEGGDQPQVVDTLGGRMHVRSDQDAAATPHGQLVFFAEFLAATGVFERACQPVRWSIEATTPLCRLKWQDLATSA
jgi:hypothetical protein